MLKFEDVTKAGEANTAQGKPIDLLSGDELDALLDWHIVPRKDQCNNPQRKQKWITAHNQSPPLSTSWTAQNKERLKEDGNRYQEYCIWVFD